MKKGQEPAFPATSDNLLLQGMSTRLYLAGMAMCALVTGSASSRESYKAMKLAAIDSKCLTVREYMAKQALDLADELLKQEETRQ